MKTKSFKLSVQRGFSLVELLVVIAVIAIIAAIAIPNIANITTQAGVAKDQRNAQNIASVAAAARAAGSDDVRLGEAANVIAALEGGIAVPQTGGQPDLTFGISPMTPDEEDGAETYLDDATAAGGAVVYNPANS